MELPTITEPALILYIPMDRTVHYIEPLAPLSFAPVFK